MFRVTRYPMISKTESGRVGYRKKYRVAGRVRVPAGHCTGEVSPSEAREVLEQGLQFQNLAEVHLATLNPYTSGKNGTHILSALKVVTGSESFLALSEERKGCGNTEFEACQTRRYLLAVEQQCGCVPWLATFFLEHKVKRAG